MRASRLSALFLTTAIPVFGIQQAEALDVDAKGSFAQIEQELAQDNQIEVARAKYVLNDEDPGKAKILCVKFTMNAKGDAYILMSDGMDDSQAHMEMVYGKLKNAHVFNPHDVGVLPQGISAQSNLARLIQRGATAGDGVLIHGESVKKSANGAEVVVGLTTVMANVYSANDRYRYNRVGILVTSNTGIANVDKVVATDLRYQEIKK